MCVHNGDEARGHPGDRPCAVCAVKLTEFNLYPLYVHYRAFSCPKLGHHWGSLQHFLTPPNWRGRGIEPTAQNPTIALTPTPISATPTVHDMGDACLKATDRGQLLKQRTHRTV